MKPLKLIMGAFGPYADIQEIDFTELGAGGLYLITGETGSGKTTVFDAISFALFGKASGAARDDYSMLRSDFAAEKAKTFVELDFASGDSRYNIRRTIKKPGQDVVLTLPDGTELNGDRNIKPKITEIIGLDRDQFAQIVMIAQNDFLRFLQSGTEERLKILRRIFGTEALKQFQERLKALARSENDKRALILHDFERYEVDVYKRDEQFADWEIQIKADTSELSDVNKKLAICDKEKQALAAEIAVAEELRKKFADLAGYRRDRDAHEAKAGEMEKLRARAACGEAALYKVKPSADEAKKAALNLSVGQADLKSANEQAGAAKTELEEAKINLGALPPPAEAQGAYATLSGEWEAAVEKLKRLTELHEGRDDIAAKRTLLDGKREELNAALDAIGKLPPVSELQTEFNKIAAELQREENKMAALTALQDDISLIADKQAELSKGQAEFETLNIRFTDADERYRTLEEAFLRGQAGIIAATLADGEPCPVCGSADHPAPAKLSNSDISEANLKKAGEAKALMQSKRDASSSFCGTLKAETETLLKRFMSDVSPLIPDASAETAPALLEEYITESRSDVADFLRRKNDTGKALSELELNFEKLTKKRDELTPAAAALESEVDTLTKRFLSDACAYIPDAKWDSSGAELADLLSQTQSIAGELTSRRKADKEALDLLILNWDAATKRKTDAEAAAKSTQTLVTERAANEQKLLKRLGEAQSAYEAALAENGFAGEGDYTAALITVSELAEFKKRASDHDKLGGQLTRDVARLEKETAGKKEPDLERLKLEGGTLESTSNALNEKRDEINGRLQKTAGSLAELRRAASDFEKTEKAYAAVKQLADAANGKLDFETYAQTAYFKRVLRAANFRLKVMSENRYTLLRKTDSGDLRRRFGLELEVLDAYTGKARSANSLSGGESFMASLSLALGLSDVVQQSAGGIRLDSMFIDEGFGTLDGDVLELAIRTLTEMAGINRTIGVISHVTELRERIDRQIQVEKTTAGSRITIR